MALDQQASNLITTTINAFNGNSTTISPMDGISLIDSWVSTLRSTGQETNPVVGGLGDLKTELQSGNPDGTRIGQLINELADQLKAAADSAETDVQNRLNALVEALQGFSRQLSGSSGGQRANNQQAPMTSTVGGESTNSGTGASAYRTPNDDDFSDRIGGTTSVATGMDDPTGSDGGSGGMDPDGGPSPAIGNNVSDNDSAMGMEDTTGNEGVQRLNGDSAGSGGDDYSAGSGTQRSGVSGGSADSGSGSSGGRSQY